METVVNKLLFEGVRPTAVKILNRVERTDAYLDKILAIELRENDWNDLDKSLLNEIVHGVLRWQMKLDWVINGFFHASFSKSEVIVKNCLRVAVYQILFLNKIPHHAIVNEAVEFMKRIRSEKAGNLVNGVLRNIIRSINDIHYPDPKIDAVQYLAIMYSYPTWMVRRWHERYGYAETEKLLEYENRIPTLSLRMNSLKMKEEELVQFLKDQNCEVEKSKYLSQFIKCPTISNISESELFKKGFVTVQDESAGLACKLLDPKENEYVIDMCAAPGGKTSFISELMKNTGKILAVDKYSERLKLIEKSIQRLGLTNIKLKAADAIELETELANKILIDVPCSGLGVLSKKPDIKIKREVEDIFKLVVIQREILEHASKLLLPGGSLVYSTCTIEPEENFDQIKLFLENHPEFSIDDARNYVDASLVNSDGAIETLPHKHNIDGSFAIRLTKKI